MPVLALLVLSPIGAELLAAYNDTTGRPLALLGNLVFFAALYGCPALLIRELACRTGRGWPAILLLSAAAGLLQAGVLDQSLFSESYDDVRGWEESVRATYVEPLGLSAYMAQNFILGHVIFSFAAPIALAEALRPAGEPWLRRRGHRGRRGAWLAVAALLIADTSEPRATVGELAVTLAVVAALVAAALRTGRRRATRSPRSSVGLHGLSPDNSTLARTPPLATAPASSPAAPTRRAAPRVRTALGASFLLTAAYSMAPETWAGAAFALAVAALALVLLARHAWTLEHVVAIASGALLARGALAFTYYPVVGETSAAQKYAHNVVMLAVSPPRAPTPARPRGAGPCPRAARGRASA